MTEKKMTKAQIDFITDRIAKIKTAKREEILKKYKVEDRQSVYNALYKTKAFEQAAVDYLKEAIKNDRKEAWQRIYIPSSTGDFTQDRRGTALYQLLKQAEIECAETREKQAKIMAAFTAKFDEAVVKLQARMLFDVNSKNILKELEALSKLKVD